MDPSWPVLSECRDMNDITKTQENLGYFIKQKIAFVSLYCHRNMNDIISTRKIPENTRLHLVFSLDIFQVEMMSFMFLSQHRATQAIVYLLNTILLWQTIDWQKYAIVICSLMMGMYPSWTRLLTLVLGEEDQWISFLQFLIVHILILFL